ncbi:uncharacterized protein AB675_3496 [Cyphellophora attinorum]|uniref:Mid2 domain-containing protein n=1 Tax=Cyphellophora attinorum TaxID=1664694 RepID=A0A0N1H8Z8_9EURO|nr:uncharacterized protein AB675_3496 [Phialophora attinorum]KPI39820.1 hypothetical protein AB675_3496 [Phialophora attinorum]
MADPLESTMNQTSNFGHRSMVTVIEVDTANATMTSTSVLANINAASHSSSPSTDIGAPVMAEACSSGSDDDNCTLTRTTTIKTIKSEGTTTTNMATVTSIFTSVSVSVMTGKRSSQSQSTSRSSSSISSATSSTESSSDSSSTSSTDSSDTTSATSSSESSSSQTSESGDASTTPTPSSSESTSSAGNPTSASGPAIVTSTTTTAPTPSSNSTLPPSGTDNAPTSNTKLAWIAGPVAGGLIIALAIFLLIRYRCCRKNRKDSDNPKDDLPGPYSDPSPPPGTELPSAMAEPYSDARRNVYEAPPQSAVSELSSTEHQYPPAVQRFYAQQNTAINRKPVPQPQEMAHPSPLQAAFPQHDHFPARPTWPERTPTAPPVLERNPSTVTTVSAPTTYQPYSSRPATADGSSITSASSANAGRAQQVKRQASAPPVPAVPNILRPGYNGSAGRLRVPEKISMPATYEQGRNNHGQGGHGGQSQANEGRKITPPWAAGTEGGFGGDVPRW